MPGAWEMRPQAAVLGAILHTDHCTIGWAFGLRNLALPGQVIGLAGMPYDMARNTACMRALEAGASHLFFLDSDVIPPRDAVYKLLAHNRPIVSGLYCRRSPPAGVPVMIKDGKWITEFQPGSLVEVDLVGAGCLLIRRDVLENYPPHRPGYHWFDWRVNMQNLLPPGDCLSEDFTFCKAAREKMGLKIFVDTSVVCKHIGLAEAGHGSFQPLGVEVA